MKLLLLIPVMALLELPGVTPLWTVGKLVVRRGDSVTVPCHYQRRFREQVKFWCRGTVWQTCRKLRPVEGKVEVRDRPDELVTMLTLTGLQGKDAGRYWCAVRIGGFMTPDVRTSLELLVTDDVPDVGVSSSDVLGPVGGNVSLECLYSSRLNQSEKFWCRSGDLNSCQSEQDTQLSQHGTVHLRDKGVQLSVVLEQLQLQDEGWYWCMADGIQAPVHVTVTTTSTPTMTATPRTPITSIMPTTMTTPTTQIITAMPTTMTTPTTPIMTTMPTTMTTRTTPIMTTMPTTMTTPTTPIITTTPTTMTTPTTQIITTMPTTMATSTTPIITTMPTTMTTPTTPIITTTPTTMTTPTTPIITAMPTTMTTPTTPIITAMPTTMTTPTTQVITATPTTMTTPTTPIITAMPTMMTTPTTQIITTMPTSKTMVTAPHTSTDVSSSSHGSTMPAMMIRWYVWTVVLVAAGVLLVSAAGALVLTRRWRSHEEVYMRGEEAESAVSSVKDDVGLLQYDWMSNSTALQVHQDITTAAAL